jgi:uncharacterized protein YceH (UPF0502 family)
MLPRQPGTKESRYAHLLSGDIEVWEAPAESTASATVDDERLLRLESEVAELRKEIAEVKASIEQLKGEPKS